MSRQRKDVPIYRKLQAITEAVRDFKTLDLKRKTDIVGVACQNTSAPRLKREDFDGIMDLTLRQIMEKEGIPVY